jgi:multiple sugar transport system substrate-binding protein
MPSQGKHKTESWAWIEYILATKEGQNTMMRERGFFPAYKPAWNDPLYDESIAYFGGQKVNALWKAIALELDKPIYMTIMDATVDNLIINAINEGISKNLNPQGIKDLLKLRVDEACAEQKRQQIDIVRSVGKWHR